MKPIALCLLLVTAAVIAPSGSALAQRGRSTFTNQTPDVVLDGLRFHRIGASSGFIQITDVATGQSAGTIILNANSAPVFAAMPGYEERVRAAYRKYSEGKSEQAAAAGGGSGNATAPRAGLTVDGVVGMLEAGISEDIIMKKIRQTGQSFDLSADDMIRLKKAKASDALMKAMMEAGAPSTTGAPPPARSYPRTASPAPQPVSPSAPVTESEGRHTLQESELEQMNNGTVRFDLSAMRVDPQLLEQKPVMQYFIALNNCNDSAIERALQNELDYPALASFYRGKAAEILSGLSDTAGVVMFGGDRITPGTGIPQATVLWGRRAAGNAPIQRTLTLGEYDVRRGVFPILVSDKSRTIDIADTQRVEADRASLEKSCPVGYNTLMRSRVGSVLPNVYTVTVPSMTFSELPMSEADARRYIEGSGKGQRRIFLGVDLHLKPGAASSTRNEFAYDGTIARVAVLNPVSYEPIASLFDDRTLAPIRVKKVPSAITRMNSTREFNEEVITAVYVSQAADACGWPVTSEQKANLKRYISDVNTYGKFNDRASLNGVMASVRNGINDPSRHFCENPTERQDFDRRAATVWPRGPMAAPVN